MIRNANTVALHLVRVNREYTDQTAKDRVAAQFVAIAGLAQGLEYTQILRAANGQLRTI